MKGGNGMKVYELEEVLFGDDVEIDTEDYKLLWQGYSTMGIPDEFRNSEIIDVSINNGYLLVRIK